MKPNVRIEEYQEAPDTVSIGGIRWLTKWDVKVQFSDRDTAYAWKGRIEKLLTGEVAQPGQVPLGYIASMAMNDLRDGIFRDVAVYAEELEETVAIYTAPPAAQPAKPLTDEQIEALAKALEAQGNTLWQFARAIEAAHGINGQP